MARLRRAPAPPLAVTRSAAPAVNLVLGYAAPELAAWVSAHREAVLRAAEAVETAYMAAVDELASRLPGGVGAWERARGSVLLYDSEREEHLARASKTVEDVEGWQSRALDPHGKRSVVALLPVRALNVANRWVHGFGSATGSGWTMTRLAPSPETPLELAGYDIRRMGVDVTQQTGEDGGVSVVGPPEWERRVLHALRVLYLRSAEAFGFVRQYVDTVKHAAQSGMGIKERTIYIADKTADASPEWLASVFAHEAYHAYLRLSGQYPVYGREAEEQECNAYQLRVLRGLNAREFEVAHLASQTGDHYREVFAGTVRYNPVRG